MAGLRVGIVGAGGVGVATASALIMRGLAGRVTVYGRDGGAARGLALDFMHARPLLAQHRGARAAASTRSSARTSSSSPPAHHTTPGETRLDMLQQQHRR